MRRFTSIYIYTAHFGYHTEITLQDVPYREYTLGLFVENVEKELERKDQHTWTPARRQYVAYFPNTYTHRWTCVCRDVSPTSQIRAEVQMKRGHWFWAKSREGSEFIGLQELFNDYWSSNNRDFTILGQSLPPTSPRISSDRERQRLLSLESIESL